MAHFVKIRAGYYSNATHLTLNIGYQLSDTTHIRCALRTKATEAFFGTRFTLSGSAATGTFSPPNRAHCTCFGISLISYLPPTLSREKCSRQIGRQFSSGKSSPETCAMRTVRRVNFLDAGWIDGKNLNNDDLRFEYPSEPRRLWRLRAQRWRQRQKRGPSGGSGPRLLRAMAASQGQATHEIAGLPDEILRRPWREVWREGRVGRAWPRECEREYRVAFRAAQRERIPGLDVASLLWSSLEGGPAELLRTADGLASFETRYIVYIVYIRLPRSAKLTFSLESHDLKWNGISLL
eukprot:COSAG02_NODE_16107_length_1112_cov_15.309970_1_plen_294_part_00